MGTLITVWLDRIKNRANQITFSRIILTTVILLTCKDYPAVAFICLLCAITTDFIDGKVARINGATKFGGALDRFADKYLFLALMYIAWDSLQNPAVEDFIITTPLKIIIRIELSLMFLSVIGYLLNLSVESRRVGKWKFGFECALMIFISSFIFTPYLKEFLYSWVILFIIQVLLLITTVLAIFSLFSYVWEYTGIGWNNLKGLNIRFFGGY
ncbi:MAG: CDP-alcohol phosphatidyltransferase family protein [Candidatus Moranbacteria bacterium]|nr:CDP-alcohol phosphatidyltransferase family protein [Candidatus Moranbacteria bacterium]